MSRFLLLTVFVLICSVKLAGQNVGIGTSDPSEKLEVPVMISPPFFMLEIISQCTAD